MTVLKRWCAMVSLLAVILTGNMSSPASVVASETVWTAITAGIEYAMMPAAIEGKVRGEVLVVRITPSQAMFRVYYQAGRCRTVQQWARQYPGAAVIVNANFMRGNGKAVGLVRIGNDILSQSTGNPISGQFEVKADVPTIGALASVEDSNSYTESFESYPLLLLDGKQVYQPLANEKRSHRSVLAQDAQGRILVIITRPLQLTLAEVIDWLMKSNLNIMAALNLDGGSSSQVYVATDNLPALYKQGSAAVPVVLAVYPR